mgnify:CR=1 FL=1
MTWHDPEELRRRLARYFDTVPHLESLLLLWRSGAQPWSAVDIAARVYVPVDEAERILVDLCRHGLAMPVAAVTPETVTRYRYLADWDADGSRMAAVATTYARHLVRVTRHVHARASNGVREFARAFRLKKE